MKSVLDMLKSKNKFEKAEGYIILSLLASSIMLSLGIGLSIFKTTGVFAVLAMLGALFSFLSAVALIVLWIVEDMTK
ncbi:MAG: hypothetical protein N3E38_02850 [Candidatus Aenigmarchaeota archaeon]|nr:hypothetical protein [Candidatus Aenigmarchaeota archaeon]MCX8179643.1 hypothetical protein [Candidatus Aenigmarchaeota archaeon]